MKRKRILYGLTILIAVLSISIALAIVPPPPANQDLGLYDTVFGEFTEDECRSCHSSGVPDTHHMLVPDKEYNCTDCHLLGPSGGIDSPIRDCLVCHLASPHHYTDEALDRHCSHCHGSLVDDYDDGHYIPTYEPSSITPDTSYNWMNSTSGKKWGGCEACHEANTTSVSGAAIYDNYVTHHSIWPGDDDMCNVCHDVTGVNLSLRRCEDCHGVKSLHNIQYNYNDTKGVLGYGHIGDSWDCMGCHAWYEAYSDLPSIVTPCLEQVSPGKLVAGEENVLTITGTNFVDTVKGIEHTSKVVIGTGKETITLEPVYINATKIVVTIPKMGEGNYVLKLAKSGMNSKLAPLVVVPQATIDSATIKKDNVIIRGSGFGDESGEAYNEVLGVTITCEGNALETSILSWSDRRIVVGCPAAAVGDEATVTTLYGSDSATIVGSRIR